MNAMAGYASAAPADDCYPLEQCAMAITGSWEPANLTKYDINWGLMPLIYQHILIQILFYGFHVFFVDFVIVL